MAVRLEFRVECDSCPNITTMVGEMIPEGWHFVDTKGWRVSHNHDTHPTNTRVTCPPCQEAGK